MIEVKIGERYEHLTVLCDAGVVIKNNGKRYRVVSCKCDCGNVCQKTLYGLRSGKSKRCKKCSTSIINKKNTKHGMSHTRVHEIWMGIMRRCYDSKHNGYINYGSRGINVCTQWHDFRVFYNDMGEPPEGCSIERIDNNGDYEPANCRWATNIEQANNKRNNKYIIYNGEKKTIPELSRMFGIPKDRLYQRVRFGIDRNILFLNKDLRHNHRKDTLANKKRQDEWRDA